MDWKTNIREWRKSQSRFKLAVAGCIVIALPLFILSRPQGAEFRKQATQEIEMAKKICVIAYDEIRMNPDRLKMDRNTLNDIPVNGSVPRLKYVDYPKVMYMHNGFARINTTESFYCVINDPRGRNEYGTNAYYYDYKDRSWRGSPMPHRKVEGFSR